MKYFKLLILFIIFLTGCDVTDNNPANEINSIYLLDAHIRQENLSSLLSNKLIKYSVPLKIFIKDKEYKGTIESQGSGSRYLPKWSYELNLDDKIIGLNDFNLSAQVSDRSMLRTILASYVYKETGFEVFNSDFAFLKINDENKGLYYIIERIEKDFFARRNIPVYEIIRTLFGAKFTFKDGDNIYEFFEEEINDDDNLYNFENFINALDTVQQENIPTELGKFLDINSYLKYHAVSTVIAAKDGFQNNIVFYKEKPESAYKTLPWDFDGSFNPEFSEIFYGDNEIIKKLLLNDSCLTIYKEYYTSCLQNIFTEENLFPYIEAAEQKIKGAYNLDPYLGEAGYNFDNEVKELKDFISARRQLLLSNLNNFQSLKPSLVIY